MKKELVPPELVLDNSDFEYFLKDTIESLIYIESMTTTRIKISETTVVQGVKEDNNIYIYQYDGADRGGRILISDSTFKHSFFCKGMIVYRNSQFDSIDKMPL